MNVYIQQSGKRQEKYCYYSFWTNGVDLLAINNEPILILHRISKIFSACETSPLPSAVSGGDRRPVSENDLNAGSAPCVTWT